MLQVFNLYVNPLKNIMDMSKEELIMYYKQLEGSVQSNVVMTKLMRYGQSRLAFYAYGVSESYQEFIGTCLDWGIPERKAYHLVNFFAFTSVFPWFLLSPHCSFADISTHGRSLKKLLLKMESRDEEGFEFLRGLGDGSLPRILLKFNEASQELVMPQPLQDFVLDFMTNNNVWQSAAMMIDMLVDQEGAPLATTREAMNATQKAQMAATYEKKMEAAAKAQDKARVKVQAQLGGALDELLGAQVEDLQAQAQIFMPSASAGGGKPAPSPEPRASALASAMGGMVVHEHDDQAPLLGHDDSRASEPPEQILSHDNACVVVLAIKMQHATWFQDQTTQFVNVAGGTTCSSVWANLWKNKDSVERMRQHGLSGKKKDHKVQFGAIKYSSIQDPVQLEHIRDDVTAKTKLATFREEGYIPLFVVQLQAAAEIYDLVYRKMQEIRMPPMQDQKTIINFIEGQSVPSLVQGRDKQDQSIGEEFREMQERMRQQKLEQHRQSQQCHEQRPVTSWGDHPDPPVTTVKTEPPVAVKGPVVTETVNVEAPSTVQTKAPEQPKMVKTSPVKAAAGKVAARLGSQFTASLIKKIIEQKSNVFYNSKRTNAEAAKMQWFAAVAMKQTGARVVTIEGENITRCEACLGLAAEAEVEDGACQGCRDEDGAENESDEDGIDEPEEDEEMEQEQGTEPPSYDDQFDLESLAVVLQQAGNGLAHHWIRDLEEDDISVKLTAVATMMNTLLAGEFTKKGFETYEAEDIATFDSEATRSFDILRNMAVKKDIDLDFPDAVIKIVVQEIKRAWDPIEVGSDSSFVSFQMQHARKKCQVQCVSDALDDPDIEINGAVINSEEIQLDMAKGLREWEADGDAISLFQNLLEQEQHYDATDMIKCIPMLLTSQSTQELFKLFKQGKHRVSGIDEFTVFEKKYYSMTVEQTSGFDYPDIIKMAMTAIVTGDMDTVLSYGSTIMFKSESNREVLREYLGDVDASGGSKTHVPTIMKVDNMRLAVMEEQNVNKLLEVGYTFDFFPFKLAPEVVVYVGRKPIVMKDEAVDWSHESFFSNTACEQLFGKDTMGEAVFFFKGTSSAGEAPYIQMIKGFAMAMNLKVEL